ncbi:MAG TPA: hypothetical protein PK400_05370 [Phycisphaerales bacterium]|nr:hypothetical protein [Phycisphaerales bacterium]
MTIATDSLLLAAPDVKVEAGAEKKRPSISIVAYSGGVMRRSTSTAWMPRDRFRCSRIMIPASAAWWATARRRYETAD